MRIIWNRECERKGTKRLNILLRLKRLFPWHWLLRTIIWMLQVVPKNRAYPVLPNFTPYWNWCFYFEMETNLQTLECEAVWPSSRGVCFLGLRLHQGFQSRWRLLIGALGLVPRTRMILKPVASCPAGS